MASGGSDGAVGEFWGFEREDGWWRLFRLEGMVLMNEYRVSDSACRPSLGIVWSGVWRPRVGGAWPTGRWIRCGTGTLVETLSPLLREILRSFRLGHVSCIHTLPVSLDVVGRPDTGATITTTSKSHHPRSCRTPSKPLHAFAARHLTIATMQASRQYGRDGIAAALQDVYSRKNDRSFFGGTDIWAMRRMPSPGALSQATRGCVELLSTSGQCTIVGRYSR